MHRVNQYLKLFGPWYWLFSMLVEMKTEKAYQGQTDMKEAKIILKE